MKRRASAAPNLNENNNVATFQLGADVNSTADDDDELMSPTDILKEFTQASSSQPPPERLTKQRKSLKDRFLRRNCSDGAEKIVKGDKKKVKKNTLSVPGLDSDDEDIGSNVQPQKLDVSKPPNRSRALSAGKIHVR
jgi:hypothetical protein